MKLGASIATRTRQGRGSLGRQSEYKRSKSFFHATKWRGSAGESSTGYPRSIDDGVQLGSRDECGVEGQIQRWCQCRGTTDSEGDAKAARSVTGECRYDALVNNAEVGTRRGRHGGGPRNRCEAENYNDERPPPGRNAVEHAVTGYCRTTDEPGARYPSFAVTTHENPLDRLTELANLSRVVVAPFRDAGFSLYAVGGAVRDALLGAPLTGEREIDFTTNARPDDIERLLTPLCSATWVQGRAFGTIGGVLRANGLKVEITTFRSESYVDHSRKPAVEWGDSLEADLSRRDFTINAMALDVVALINETPNVQTFFDYFHGFRDLHERVLRTPIDPATLFRDDPLRMLRAARFAARFELTIDPALEAAATSMAEQLEKVSPERVRSEMDLLMLTSRPSIGLDFIVRTGLADVFFPELPKLQLEQDPIHQHKDVLKHTWAVVDKTSPSLVLRLAALFHDVGKPATRAFSDEGVTFRFHEVVGAKLTRKRMKALKYSQEMIDDVSSLVELHLRFHTYKMGWSDKAVRRYVRDAGPLLQELNELTRCDCTTRNKRKAAILARRMDELEIRIEEVRKNEDLSRLRPALDGVAVMEILGLRPGRDVGRALDFLMEIRLDEGEISREEATYRLREWWAEQS